MFVDIKKYVSVGVVSLAVAGCGGGGSSSGGGNSTPATTGSVQGGAAKGIVSDGLIKAYTLTANGSKGAEVGSAETGSDGQYTLQLAEAYDGASALLLELTADADTRMVCDALAGCGDVAYGDKLTPGADFLLTAIIPAVTGSSDVNAQITGFTHMAAERVKAGGAVSTASINAANSSINQLVGVNITETVPVDITSASVTGGVEQQRYAMMLAALADQAFVDADGDSTVDAADMMAKLNDFAADAADGLIGDDAGGLSLEAYKDAVVQQATSDKNTQLDAAAVSQASGHANVVAALVDDNGAFETGTSSIADHEDEIAQAKALVAETRNWVSSLEALESPADAFGDEIDTIDSTLDVNSQVLLARVGDILDDAVAAIDANGGEIPATFTIFGLDGEVVGTGTLTDTSTDSTAGYALDVNNVAGISADLEIGLDLPVDAESIPVGARVLQVSGTVQNADTRITLADTALSVTLATAYDGTVEPDVSAVTFSSGLTFERLSNGTATGDAVTGTLSKLEMVRLASGNIALKTLAFEDLAVSSASGNSSGFDVMLTVNNAETFDTVAWLDNEIEETATEFADAELTVTGNLALEGKPEVTASVHLHRNAPGEAGLAVVTLAYDNQNLQLTYEGSEAVGDGELTVTNADGVKLIVQASQGDVTGQLLVNDTQVGTVEDNGDVLIIRYNDGVIESLQ